MPASRIPGTMCMFREGVPDTSALFIWRDFCPGPLDRERSRQQPLPAPVMTGYFTMLKYVQGLPADLLEQRLGYPPGSLKAGFCVLSLAPHETMTGKDFELKASTRWSDGKVKDKSGGTGKEIETLLAARQQDAAALREKVAGFFAKGGGNTPAKVIPRVKPSYFPDADIFGDGSGVGVPQFRLRLGVGKKAVIQHTVGW